jgi:hypothetical protein
MKPEPGFKRTFAIIGLVVLFLLYVCFVVILAFVWCVILAIVGITYPATYLLSLGHSYRLLMFVFNFPDGKEELLDHSSGWFTERIRILIKKE